MVIVPENKYFYSIGGCCQQPILNNLECQALQGQNIRMNCKRVEQNLLIVHLFTVGGSLEQSSLNVWTGWTRLDWIPELIDY